MQAIGGNNGLGRRKRSGGGGGEEEEEAAPVPFLPSCTGMKGGRDRTIIDITAARILLSLLKKEGSKIRGVHSYSLLNISCRRMANTSFVVLYVRGFRQTAQILCVRLDTKEGMSGYLTYFSTGACVRAWALFPAYACLISVSQIFAEAFRGEREREERKSMY